MDTVLVFAGGDPPGPDLVEELPTAELIVAADSGYDHAVSLGFTVEVLVGDLDSVRTDPLPDHLVVERHPTDKDATDLELALELVSRESPQRLVVVGGSGGRLDHELGTTGLLCAARWSEIDEIDWVSPRGWAHVVWDRRIIHGDIGTLLSLLPIGGATTGVTTLGLKWNLEGATLEPGSTRGLSNVMKAPVADIAVESGCLLVVIPGQSWNSAGMG